MDVGPNPLLVPIVILVSSSWLGACGLEGDTLTFCVKSIAIPGPLDQFFQQQNQLLWKSSLSSFIPLPSFPCLAL